MYCIMTCAFRIQLQRPTPRKLHALHKKQDRLFTAAAPVFFGAERAVSAFRWIQLRKPAPRNFHALHKNQDRVFIAAAPSFFGANGLPKLFI
ncbi:hypothetical protein PGRAN_10873 [Listeria grandensis FSL F6-0971]|uniref:Uncharacterized protein n=1 Tax=Listeria grandensis FSL F6-0971 TaxID=1265819 RepID=W7BAA0_9LIST|nr:hypothetical protein PGRAN_10873 [Listeria grandensis FSL F6-0971]